MNDSNQQRNDILERATRQLDIMEQLITLLMDAIELSDLKTSERLNFVLKLMTQHARTLKLSDDISGEKDDSRKAREDAFFANLRGQLRGDSSGQNLDKPLISNKGISSFFKEDVDSLLEEEEEDDEDDDINPFSYEEELDAHPF
jgi:hypothetical protein